MGILLIPAKMYFDDFAMELISYSVKRNSEIIGNFNGLDSKEHDGKYIAFLTDASIQTGDVLTGLNKTYIVKHVEYDYYNGVAEMIKAYY